VSDVTTRELLYRASDLLERPTSDTVGLWPRATAVLTRQEGIQQASVRAQLLCLRILLDDTATANDVNVTWWALSRACHHLSYELPPTAAELRAWIDVVDRFVEAS
jgi:hypothetical protein